MPAFSVENIRREIQRIFTKHAPNKCDDINNLMNKWKGKENDLLKSLCTEYNEQYIEILPSKLKDLYSIGYRLEGGSDYVVRKATRKSDNKLFSLKIFNLGKMDNDDIKIIKKSINLLRTLSHKNIAVLHDLFETKTKIILVLDYSEGGQLYDRIIEKGNFAEIDAMKISYEILSALKYLHSKDIVHCSIQPETILFDTKSNNSSVKLVAFENAESCKDHLLTGCRGLFSYFSPEMITNQKYNGCTDMWTFGVVLYIMLSGYPPFYDNNDNLDGLYKVIKSAKYELDGTKWDNVSDQAKDLISKLLVVDTKKRYTAIQALQHNWFYKINIDTILHTRSIEEALNKINNKDKLLVYGYIRSQNNPNISLTIQNYVILYTFYGK